MSRWIRIGRPSLAELDGLLVSVRDAAVSYSHVGSTLGPSRPGERRHERPLGVGAADFAAAVDGLRRWRCHRFLGAAVHPEAAPLEVGADLLVVLRAGPLSIVVPNRIVAVVDDGDRFGFAYGTLPGHQERGEESFVVERSADGSVRATIRVHATGASRPARVAAPVLGLLQRGAAMRYLAGLARHVAVSP